MDLTPHHTGYRVVPMSEDKKTKAEKIEVTPEMIEEGIDAIEPFALTDAAEGWYDRVELVTKIYRAMFLARPSTSPKQSLLR